MTRSILTLTAKPGKRDALVDAFRRLAILDGASQSPGFLRGEVHLPVGRPNEVVVTVSWRDRQAYERYLASPWRDGIQRGLEPYVTSLGTPIICEPVEEVVVT